MRSDATSSASELLGLLDGSGSDKERAAIQEMRLQLGSLFPDMLKSHFGLSRCWKVRAACVFYCLAYARSSGAAIELGKLGVLDKSKVVRYRACMLLACSLDRGLLPFLKEKQASAEPSAQSDLAAAIDAIESQNQNYFLDRDHTGMITLSVKLDG